jgi:hypothetical protein
LWEEEEKEEEEGWEMRWGGVEAVVSCWGTRPCLGGSWLGETLRAVTTAAAIVDVVVVGVVDDEVVIVVEKIKRGKNN